MPTFNQLVRQGRHDKRYKSKAPVLQHGFNTLTNAPTDQPSPRREAFAPRFPPPALRSRTLHFVRLQEYV